VGGDLSAGAASTAELDAIMGIANARNSHLYSGRPQPTASSPRYLKFRAETMIVCVCRRVSDREIARHARAGMGFDDIQFELGVATQCGQCEGCARDIVAQCCASQPVAALNAAVTGARSESPAWMATPALVA
jgi:bacterioferritin-associated ferredoxin